MIKLFNCLNQSFHYDLKPKDDSTSPAPLKLWAKSVSESFDEKLITQPIQQGIDEGKFLVVNETVAKKEETTVTPEEVVQKKGGK